MPDLGGVNYFDDTPAVYEWNQLINDPVLEETTFHDTYLDHLGFSVGSDEFAETLSPEPASPTTGPEANRPTHRTSHTVIGTNLRVVFDTTALTANLPWLRDALAHDTRASDVFNAVVTEIFSQGKVLQFKVEYLVVPSGGRFFCPFSGCPKAEGWDNVRNAQSHIFIDHLQRRYLLQVKPSSVESKRRRGT